MNLNQQGQGEVPLKAQAVEGDGRSRILKRAQPASVSEGHPGAPEEDLVQNPVKKNQSRIWRACKIILYGLSPALFPGVAAVGAYAQSQYHFFPENSQTALSSASVTSQPSTEVISQPSAQSTPASSQSPQEFVPLQKIRFEDIKKNDDVAFARALNVAGISAENLNFGDDPKDADSGLHMRVVMLSEEGGQILLKNKSEEHIPGTQKYVILAQKEVHSGTKVRYRWLHPTAKAQDPKDKHTTFLLYNCADIPSYGDQKAEISVISSKTPQHQIGITGGLNYVTIYLSRCD